MRASGELPSALLCALVLACYGNAGSALVWKMSGRQRVIAGISMPLLLLALVLVWNCWIDRRNLVALGLHPQKWRSGIAWGTIAGTALALPPLLFFRIPHQAGKRIQYTELHRIGRVAFLVRIMITTPILVAFVEEVSFRGLLQSKLERAMPNRPYLNVMLSSLSFALWHMTVNLLTLRQTNVVSSGMVPQPLALIGGLLSVFAGGVTFGGLYTRTGSLVAPVLAHWLVDALILLILYPPFPRNTPDKE